MSHASHTFHCRVVVLAPRERCERRDRAGRTSADVPGGRGYPPVLNKCGRPLVHNSVTRVRSHYQLHQGKVALK
jgi:hypothetical protein